MIIPSLDLINEKVVRLYQGNYNKQLNYKDNPVSIIKKYQKLGAQIIHLVDLTGAKNPKNKQKEFLKKMISNLSISIQIGGGIRNEKDIDFFLKLGVKRIVIGSIAIKNYEIVKKWIKVYGKEFIVLAFDIVITKNKNKILKIHGWQKETNILLEKILDIYYSTGIKHVLCTDISCDGTLKGPNFSLYKEIVLRYPKIHFQASGGIGSLNDIAKLKKLGVQNIIVGRSLLENKINIQDAIICWQKE